VTILLLTWPRGAGDIVVPGTWYGYAYLGLGMLIGLAFVARAWWRDLPARGASAESELVR
jgi:hypothetical protein